MFAGKPNSPALFYYLENNAEQHARFVLRNVEAIVNFPTKAEDSTKGLCKGFFGDFGLGKYEFHFLFQKTATIPTFIENSVFFWNRRVTLNVIVNSFLK